jgi:hypothetical protein
MLMAYTGIRRVCEQDVPQVADLHRRVMRPTVPATGSCDDYEKYFGDVFLSDAARDSGLASLVYQREGRIAGFLGVMPRRMQFHGKPLLAAVCSQFVVDPAERGQAGLQMLKRCFAGDQDLSITDEAADCTRKIWEWCGGVTALPYSLHWVRPLRPAQAALTVSGDRYPSLLTRVLSPMARAVDAIITRPAGKFRPAPPTGSRSALDDAALLKCLNESAARCSLAPAYDRATVTWALDRARARAECGAVRAQVVRDDSDAVVGWFIYHASRSGSGEVLQTCALPRYHRVLDHLLADAWEQGVVMLSGRLEPDFAPALSENRCLLYRRGHWTLIQSRRPEVADALQRGDALFTRLEGEWCLRFP